MFQKALVGLWTTYVLLMLAHANEALAAASTLPSPASRDDLVADFGPTEGLWLRDGGTTAWTQLHALSAKNIVSGDLDGNGIDEVIVDFGPSQGIWIYYNNSTWIQLHASTANRLAVGDLDGNGKAELLVDFPGFGIWVWANNTSWSQLHPSNSSNIVIGDLDGNGYKDAIIDFPGSGVWVWQNNTSWFQLHPLNSRLMTVGDLDGNGQDDVIVDFAGYGIWNYANNSSWSQVHSRNASHLAAGDLDGNGQSDLIVDFGSQSGIWLLMNGTTWSQLQTLTSTNIVTGSVDGKAEIIINLGDAGLWKYANDTSWSQLHSMSPGAMAVGHMNVSGTRPPSAPGLPTPVDAAIGIGLNTPLTWSANGATSYDVSFGIGNPPALVTTGLTSAAFAPSAMVNGVTYFWQVAAHNATGTTTGPVWSFSTVGAVVASAGAPRLYSAIADRTAYAKPTLPQLGAAGFAFNDPMFGSKILRVTDGATRPGRTNVSFRVPSNAHLAAWNATSTAFYVESNDGTLIPFSFDPATMTANRIQPTSTGNGGFTLGFYVEPQFSVLNSNIIYGVTSGSNNRTIAQFDFSTGAYTTILNLDTIVSGLANTYVGGLMSGGRPMENLLTFFGGAGQDAHYYALWAPIGNPTRGKLLNTVTSTINGKPTSTILNFHLHSVSMDKGGRYVFLYPTGVDLATPRLAAQAYLWDTASDTITAITTGMHPGGHDAAGYGYWINQDCCTSSTWDAAQWQFRALTALSQTSDLIAPVPASKEVYLADHTSWNNAQPTELVPVISSTYRYGNNTTPLRAWDDEIIGIQTAGGGGGIVWRFAHHRSSVASDTVPTTPYFWYEPIANVSPDGKWVLFTSNWEKTLGTDSSNDSGGAGTFRQDVFVVQLTPQP